MKLASLMLRAIDRELRHVAQRGGRNVSVEVKHPRANELVATVESSLGGQVEIRSFVCWERNPRKSPLKRIVWARPETTILVSVA